MRQSEDLLLKNAMPQEIDRVVFDFGFPMAPFAMRDLAGLDIGWLGDKTPIKTRIFDTNSARVVAEARKRGQGFTTTRMAAERPFPTRR